MTKEEENKIVAGLDVGIDLILKDRSVSEKTLDETIHFLRGRGIT